MIEASSSRGRAALFRWKEGWPSMRRPAVVKSAVEGSPPCLLGFPAAKNQTTATLPFALFVEPTFGVRCTLGSDRVKTLLSARRSADDQMPVVFDRGHWRSRLRLRRLVFAVLRVGVTSGRVRTVIRLVEDSLFLWMAGVEIKCSSSRLHPAAWRCARARRPRQ